EVVQAVDVVRVAVGEPDGVEPVDAGAEELEAELGWRIDEDPVRPVVALEEGGVPGPPVPRIGRGAGPARAADDGDPEGGAGPEEVEPHSSSTRNRLVVPRTWKGTPAVT